MRIYAKRGHTYEDREAKKTWVFPEQGWIDVPDPIGRKVLADHSPDKLVDITGAADPEAVAERLRAGLPLDPEPPPKVVEQPTKGADAVVKTEAKGPVRKR